MLQVASMSETKYDIGYSDHIEFKVDLIKKKNTISKYKIVGYILSVQCI